MLKANTLFDPVFLSRLGAPGGGSSIGTQLMASVLSHWNLDEASGNPRLDSAPASRTLAESDDPISSAAGKIGDAADFSVFSTGALYRPSDDNMTPPGGELSSESRTYAFWVYLNNGGGELIGKNNAALGPAYGYPETAFRVYWEGGTEGFIRLDVGTVAGTSIKSCQADAITWHGWHFVVVTIGAVNRISVDGADWVATTAGMIPRANHATVALVVGGNYYDPGSSPSIIRSTNSIIDHLTIFDRSLSLDEALWLFNSTAGREFPYGLWPAPEFTPDSGELTPALDAYVVGTGLVIVNYSIQQRLLGSGDAWVEFSTGATGNSILIGYGDSESELYWPATYERRVEAFIGSEGPYYSGIYTRA